MHTLLMELEHIRVLLNYKRSPGFLQSPILVHGILSAWVF